MRVSQTHLDAIDDSQHDLDRECYERARHSQIEHNLGTSFLAQGLEY